MAIKYKFIISDIPNILLGQKQTNSSAYGALYGYKF